MPHWYIASASSSIVLQDGTLYGAIDRARLHPKLKDNDIVVARLATCQEATSLLLESEQLEKQIPAKWLHARDKFQPIDNPNTYVKLSVEFVDDIYVYGVSTDGQYLQRFLKGQSVKPIR